VRRYSDCTIPGEFANPQLAWSQTKGEEKMRIPSATKSVKVLLLVATLIVGGLSAAGPQELKAHHSDQPARDRASEAYAKLPLSFEANQGQTDNEVKFLSRASRYTLFLTPTEMVLSFNKPHAGSVLRMHLVEGNSQPQVAGMEQLRGKVSYFIGNDPRQWHKDVPTYAKVRYQSVYPGIDMIYYGNQRQVEYDFVVAPGADAAAIKLAFEGAEKLDTDAQGNLVMHTAAGDIIQQAPVIYQESGGIRQTIPGHYVLQGRDQVGFQVAAYDRSRPLIIDPTMLGYSTYLGGASWDKGFAIFVDASGYAYVTGETRSTDLPRRLNTYTSGGVAILNPTNDAFVSILDSAGALVQSVYFGDTGDESGKGIAVDATGRVFVAGSTTSLVLPGAAGPAPMGTNAFVAMFGPIGSSTVSSTFLGGDNEDSANGIALDTTGRVYVAGTTYSTNFPTTPGAFQPMASGFGDAFVARFNFTNSAFALDYSVRLGGSNPDAGNGIAVDRNSNAYVTGRTMSTNFPTTAGTLQPTKTSSGTEAFVTKVNSTGSALVYSTYLGDLGNGYDEGTAIAVGINGNAYVTGFTDSQDNPTTSAYEGFPIQHAYQSAHACGYDAFLSRLNSLGSALDFSTYLGGCGNDVAYGIAVDRSGNAYVTGTEGWSDFPQVNPLPYVCQNGPDAFVAKFSSTGTLLYSTCLGGSSADEGHGIAVSTAGNAYVTGYTGSTDFPTVNASQPAIGTPPNQRIEWDAFVAVVALPNLRAGCCLNIPASISPGTNFTVTYSVSNPALASAGASVTRFYLSRDTIISPGSGPFALDTLLNTTQNVGALAAGATTLASVTLNIPATVGTGTYYLGVCADDTKLVLESNELDNCQASSTTMQVINPANISDLLITWVTISTPSVAAGGSFRVTDETANDGNGASTQTSTYYRLVTDPRMPSTGTLLGSRSVGGLFSGTTSVGTVTLTINSTVARGSYFVSVCADGANSAIESNETNNCQTVPIQVQ